MIKVETDDIESPNNGSVTNRGNESREESWTGLLEQGQRTSEDSLEEVGADLEDNHVPKTEDVDESTRLPVVVEHTDADMTTSDHETAESSNADESSNHHPRRSLRDILLGSLQAVVIFILSGFTELLLIVSIYFRSGSLRGRSGMHGISMISIMIISIVILLIYEAAAACISMSNRKKRQRDCTQTTQQANSLNELPLAPPVGPPPPPPTTTTTRHRVKRLFLRVLLPLAVVLLIGTEIILVIMIPHASIFPLKPPFAQDALIVGGDYVPTGCDNVQEMFQEAKTFFHNNTLLNLDNILIVYRAKPLKGAAAMVFDQTIYLNKNMCPWTSLLVHEIVHIYQEQIGYWSGRGGPSKAFGYFADSIRCSACLYDYGGFQGLQAKMELGLAGDEDAADIHTAFGSEQMAEIVQDYYVEYDWCHSTDMEDYWGDWSSECKALEYYASQIIVS
jgi:hypothetical protein